MATPHALTVPGDVPIAVLDHGGDGQPLLALHGAARTAEDLALLAPLLEGFRVLAMDLRGHGRSGDGPFSLDAAVEDVARVIAHLDLRAPVILGHSLGGMIAVLAAGRLEGVAAAVNLDGFGQGDPSLCEGYDPEDAARQLDDGRTRALASLPTEPFTADAFRAAEEAMIAAATGTGLDVEQLRRALHRSAQADADGMVRLRPSPSELAGVLAAADEFDVTASLLAVHAPTMVVIATADPPADIDPVHERAIAELRAAHRRGLRKRLAAAVTQQPLAHLELLAVHHGLLLTDAAIVAGRVNAFLGELRLGSAA